MLVRVRGGASIRDLYTPYRQDAGRAILLGLEFLRSIGFGVRRPLLRVTRAQ